MPSIVPAEPLLISLGDARTWRVTFRDPLGAPLNLTGWSLELYDVDLPLRGFVTVAWAPAPGGAAFGQADLHLVPIPDLALHEPHGLRIRRTPPAAQGGAARALGTPRIRIVAQ